jgi:hypothetical protein
MHLSDYIPRVSHKKYSAKAICSGADQIIFRYAVRSINLCASTDMRFTISPTVDSFREVFDIRKAWIKIKKTFSSQPQKKVTQMETKSFPLSSF